VSSALLLAGLIVWAIGAAVDLVWGADRGWSRLAPYAAGLVGAVPIAVSGAVSVLGTSHVIDLGASLGVGETSIRLDPLAGLFLALSGGLAGVVSLCLLGWSRPSGRITGRGASAGYLLLLGSVAVVVTAGDAFTFLFGWESLTVAFYVLVAVRRRDSHWPRAAWRTLVFGNVSGAALLLGFLLLAGAAGTFSFSGWTAVGPGALHDAAYALIMAGFAAKVGVMPFEVWLPAGYPRAPGPIRAAMSGLAANVGFYGLWRFLGVLGPPPLWLVVTVLVVGGLTALLGIAFAAVDGRLDRVIAYSSVENAGIILVGYGVALAGSATHTTRLVAVGLLAASLQILAHAVAKSGLFASASFIESDYGTDALEQLHGVGHRYPTSGATFALGSLTLAGLPPTIGFVSEWFILEALLQEYRVHVLALRLGMAVAGALVALTAGVAALAFIRLIGLFILGRPDPVPTTGSDRSEGGIPGRSGLLVLAVSTLALAAFAPWIIRFIADGLAPVVPRAAVASALKSPWVLQPVFPNFSILSPSWLFVLMPIAFASGGLVVIVLSGGRIFRPRRVPAWRSATAGTAGPDRYSSFGYANAIRHVLGNVLSSEHEVVEVDEPDDYDTGTHPHIEVRSTVVEPVETHFYRPLGGALLKLVDVAKRLQSGRLDAYIAYLLFALVAVLAIVAALK
jgi:hydrogenase-4 component B